MIELPKMDEPPSGGEFAPEVTELEATPEEIAAGNALAEHVDPYGVAVLSEEETLDALAHEG